jgi:hypothetical protein
MNNVTLHVDLAAQLFGGNGGGGAMNFMNMTALFGRGGGG